MDKQLIKDIHAKYERLVAKDSPYAGAFFIKNRHVLESYDPRGNWVGPVAHENGWTP